MSDPSESKEHHVAMSVIGAVASIRDLAGFAQEPDGLALVQRDLPELEHLHTCLGKMIRLLKAPTLQAAE